MKILDPSMYTVVLRIIKCCAAQTYRSGSFW